jgi:hypothetical protein
MSRFYPRAVEILLLFSSLLTQPVYAEEESLYKTTFLVGPDPQPVIPDNGIGDVFSPPDGVILPTASNPTFGQSGARHLGFNLRDTSPKQNNWKSYLRHDNLTDSESRSLSGEVGTITTTFLGSNNDDNGAETGFFWYPPDPIGVAGSRRLVAVINTLMEVRFKNGTLIFRDGFPHFFFSLPEAYEANFVDPKVIWDEHSNRFVIIVLQIGFSPNFSRIWYAVSKDETPDSFKDWHKGYINSVVNVGGEDAWTDYPGLEVDEEAVYVTANLFTFSGSYGGVHLWVLDKGTMGGLYSGGALSYYDVNPFKRAGPAGTTMPTQVHGAGGVGGSVGTFLLSLIIYDDGRVDLEIVTRFP